MTMPIAERPKFSFNMLSRPCWRLCLPGNIDWFVNRPYREQTFIKANISLSFWQDTGRMVQRFVCRVGAV